MYARGINKNWSPPMCFVCKSFNGVTGMDMMCKKNKVDTLGVVSKETIKKCRKEHWYRFEELRI